MPDSDIKIVAQNKKAFHDFTISQRWEAGIVLTGSEIKSARNGRVQLRDSFARFQKEELWVVGVHISPYENGAYANHPAVRPRKLLLNRSELNKLKRQVEEKGATLIPVLFYLKHGLAKVEIGLAFGKRQYDKRAAISEREEHRSLQRELKDRHSGKRSED